MTTVTLDKVESYIEARKEQEAAKYNQYISTYCAFEVVVNGDSYPCETLEKALELADMFKAEGEEAKVILGNGEEYVKEVKKEISELDNLCLDIFGTIKPKNKSFEFTLKQVLEHKKENRFLWQAAYCLVFYGTSGRINAKSQVKLMSMSGRKLLGLILKMKNNQIFLSADKEYSNQFFIQDNVK